MPIAQYVKACYESWLPSDILQTTFEQIDSKVNAATNMMGMVRGRKAGTILTGRRVGWEFSGAERIVTDIGTTLDLS